MPVHGFKNFVKNFGIFISALLVVLGWILTTGISAVDHRYVHVVDHLRDSLVVDAKLARMDTSLASLVRACRRKGECP